jgi:hypothetical protein
MKLGTMLARRFGELAANRHRIMNVGSPYNVPAGSQVSMEKVIEKYKKINNEENERKLENLRNNKISSEQPFEGKTRVKKAPDMF